MKIYDKAQWHIDAGENERIVLEKFKVVFEFLRKHNLLSEEGSEIYELGIDESVSLHERLLNAEGNKFVDRFYDSIISLEPYEIEKKLDAFIQTIQ